MPIHIPSPWTRVLAIAALLAPLLLYVADRHDRTVNEHRLSAIASRIAGRPVQVRCPGPFKRLLYETDEGHVMFDDAGHPADVAELATGPCRELDALAEGEREDQLACAARSDSCGDDVQRLGGAIDTLTHESWHLAGVMDEGITECRSVQTLAWTATQLGATPQTGESLARLVLATGYQDLPVPYRSPDCTNGGRLDLRPDDPAWP
jgi:hypothetical protein